MSNIPTARTFLQNLIEENNQDSNIDLEDALIEFAKLHVEAAIKKCIECAPSGSSTDTVSYEDVVECLTDCYSLDNIK